MRAGAGSPDSHELPSYCPPGISDRRHAASGMGRQASAIFVARRAGQRQLPSARCYRARRNAECLPRASRVCALHSYSRRHTPIYLPFRRARTTAVFILGLISLLYF